MSKKNKTTHTQTQKPCFTFFCGFCQRTHTFANMCNLVATIHISSQPFSTSHTLSFFLLHIARTLICCFALSFRCGFCFCSVFILFIGENAWLFPLFLLLLSIVVVVCGVAIYTYVAIVRGDCCIDDNWNMQRHHKTFALS